MVNKKHRYYEEPISPSLTVTIAKSFVSNEYDLPSSILKVKEIIDLYTSDPHKGKKLTALVQECLNDID